MLQLIVANKQCTKFNTKNKVTFSIYSLLLCAAFWIDSDMILRQSKGEKIPREEQIFITSMQRRLPLPLGPENTDYSTKHTVNQ